MSELIIRTRRLRKDYILGAETVGLDSLLVTGGLLADAWGTERTAAPEPARLEAACRDAGVSPTAAIPAFVW